MTLCISNKYHVILVFVSSLTTKLISEETLDKMLVVMNREIMLGLILTHILISFKNYIINWSLVNYLLIEIYIKL